MPRRYLLLLLAALLAACASGPAIDTRHASRNQDSRVLYLVIHYTVGNFASSLKTLTEGAVSSHYLVDDGPGSTIYRLVEEERRAWHAGPSCWKNDCGLNAGSVGIEIVNPGPKRLKGQGPERLLFDVPFPPGQVDQVVALVRDIVERHQIHADRVLGHNEIQPLSKEDPGPLFPWKRLADEGLIAWPTAAEVDAAAAVLGNSLPEVAWFQAKLVEHGFKLAPSAQMDTPTRRALMMFQMRYRPGLCEGEPDLETAAWLAAVTSPAYKARARETPHERRQRVAGEARP